MLVAPGGPREGSGESMLINPHGRMVKRTGTIVFSSLREVTQVSKVMLRTLNDDCEEVMNTV